MVFEKFFSKLTSVKAEDEPEEEEELQDPQELLREKCRELPKAQKLAERLQECNDRVRSKSKTTETCMEELFDLMHAVDHCVGKDILNKLK